MDLPTGGVEQEKEKEIYELSDFKKALKLDP